MYKEVATPLYRKRSASQDRQPEYGQIRPAPSRAKSERDLSKVAKVSKGAWAVKDGYNVSEVASVRELVIVRRGKDSRRGQSQKKLAQLISAEVSQDDHRAQGHQCEEGRYGDQWASVAKGSVWRGAMFV
jgi:hypothetical protein